MPAGQGRVGSMSVLSCWLWLATADVSLRTRARVLDRYADAEAAFDAPAGELAALDGISLKEAKTLQAHKSADMGAIESVCAAHGIKMLTMQDAAYPQRLKNIFAPPPVLFVKGELPDIDENALIAVVGTRSASPYGLKMGRDIAFEIARAGGIVVSGLSSGIDAQAAHGALLAGGRCVSVLGTPIDAETSRLAADVAAHGALISEYAPGTKPQRSFFRDRNRISAGICVGVVAVEAPERSGVLLFANEAAEQGKEIFALPSNVDSPTGAGTNALIREGAHLVTCGWDVMGEFASRFPKRVHIPDKTPPGAEEKAPEKSAEKPPADKKVIDKENGRAYIDWKKRLAALSEDQLRIIAAIDKGGSHIDEIIENSAFPAPKVLAQLTVLEIRGIVRRGPGKRFILNTSKK